MYAHLVLKTAQATRVSVRNPRHERGNTHLKCLERGARLPNDQALGGRTMKVTRQEYNICREMHEKDTLMAISAAGGGAGWGSSRTSEVVGMIETKDCVHEYTGLAQEDLEAQARREAEHAQQARSEA